jgi:hypothetical protein
MDLWCEYEYTGRISVLFSETGLAIVTQNFNSTRLMRNNTGLFCQHFDNTCLLYAR